MKDNWVFHLLLGLWLFKINLFIAKSADTVPFPVINRKNIFD